MKLLNGVETEVRAGDYVFIFTAAGGTGSLGHALEDSGTQTITGASWTGNANGTLQLGSGTVTATLTGSATLYISGLTK